MSKTDHRGLGSSEKTDPQKTVFISYRHARAKYQALAVVGELIRRGYDLFFDSFSLTSGPFPDQIRHQIAARVHFLVILTPHSLERCQDQDDWLKHEIEHALELQRNIIPVIFDDFSFNDPEFTHLTGQVKKLAQLNAVFIPTQTEYFDAGIDRIERFLNEPPPIEIIFPPVDKAEEEQEIAATFDNASVDQKKNEEEKRSRAIILFRDNGDSSDNSSGIDRILHSAFGRPVNYSSIPVVAGTRIRGIAYALYGEGVPPQVRLLSYRPNHQPAAFRAFKALRGLHQLPEHTIPVPTVYHMEWSAHLNHTLLLIEQVSG
ncbi:MAG: toll/interleukin-1 receptor domain-containing protein, partial [Anaerolineae bacterium]|nr:toll/interleukin-1 receptor domain-containing protein [Anaerolineae bacterium]